MKIFKLPNVDFKLAKYLQLAEAVRCAIRQGQFAAGDALPSVKSLSDDTQLNRHTVMKALGELIAEGWIESRQRVGYKVVDHLPVESSQCGLSFDQDESHFERTFSYRFVREAGKVPEYPAAEFSYNFSGGQPDMALFPFSEFKSHMSDALSRPKLKQLGYGDSAGTAELIAQVKEYLRKSRAIIDREIVITNGSQEAMYIVAQLLLQKGDKVAVEELGYPPAMSAFKSAGAELLAIKQDAHGIVPENLQNKIEQGNVRLIYLTPLHQYPTTVTLSVSRRMKIYQLAAKHHIPILEDDYDHEFHYRCRPLAPMASQDPSQLVIYVSTFSKIMFPGARIGLMALSKPLAKAVERYRLLICHKSNVLMQSALARWMQSGGFERHLRRTTRINQQRRDSAVLTLKKHQMFEFVIPDGGMAIWLKVAIFTVDASNLAEYAREVGIYIQHQSQYQSVGEINQDDYIRIGFAGMNEEKFAEGIDVLVQLIRKKFLHN